MLMWVPTLRHLSKRRILNQTTRVDNEGALAWARSSSEYARTQGQARLTKLLAHVRDEIVFEMELTKGVRSA
jgi:hypothetical protein